MLKPIRTLLILIAAVALACGCSTDAGVGGGDGPGLGAGGGSTGGGCSLGRALCGSSCVALSSNNLNCGSCGSMCGAGQTCQAGACACQPGFELCSGACVPVTQDPLNCGGCGVQCQAGQACQAGACVCQAGLSDWAGTCADVQSDPNNCGACGAACATGQVCSLGACASSCAVGLMQCGASCVDLAASGWHCGACDAACPAAQQCQAGSCACGAGSTSCDGVCTDTASSPLHCGACGNACAAGQTCNAGRCACVNASETLCGAGCVDTQTDSANCGSCGNQCAGDSCVSGVCVSGASTSTGGLTGSGGATTTSATTGSGGSTGGGGSTAAGGATSTTSNEGTGGTGGTTSTTTTTTATTGGTTDGLTIEENEPAVCGVLGVVATARSGFTGAGYLDTEDLQGASVSWIVSTASAGEHTLSWRYAQEGSALGARLRVAHQDSQNVDFAPTGAGSSWQSATATVSLQAGNNHVSLVASGPGGLPNIDSITIQGTGVEAGDCSAYAPGAGSSFSAPSFRDQSVHDPSVIKSGSTYYVFGSHLAAAKTNDLLDWTLVAGDGVNANNPLFDNVVNELSEAFEWSTVVGLWAADVLQLQSNGRYLMYYNSCQGASPLSAMGIASSSNIEGPYTDDGIFLYSGGSGYNASVLPNAIDPDVFYDKNGALWMVYGSYSGGIFIMQMNPATGFPEAGEEYGTHLLGGNHMQIEGPYIQYSPHSDYYYLFNSYGGLVAGDGYNMRVARATSPAGPYYDASGLQQSTHRNLPLDASGVKLMGDYQWANSNGHGYVSPGHNSSYYEESTGQYFLIFHARFPGRGNLHQIRVHEMFINVDGWPVVAPLRYAPRNPTSPAIEYVGLGEVPASYQFVNHGRDVSGTVKTSVAASLDESGNVSGSLSGTWTYCGNNCMIVDVGGRAFRGVLSRQWNQSESAFQVTFSGIDENGVSLWGLRED